MGLEAREIIPGIVSFEEPVNFHGFGPGSDPGDNPFELSRVAIVYRPTDNSPTSFQQFDIGIGVVGYEIGNGKRIIFKKLSIEELKKELMSRPEFRQAINSPLIHEGFVNGKKAYFFTSCIPAPGYGKDAVFWHEIYYIPFEQNRGITLQLVANSEEKLTGLRELISRIKIPENPHIIIPPPPPPPTLEERNRQQISDNLREITGAAEQYVLRHRMYGAQKITFKEMLKDFPELTKLTSIDGENYETLVFDTNKPLSVNTRSLGEIQFPPKR
ncbi:MAG TPA: hypothetical protein VK717_06795 [Opitutaceae bacterium]|nr:hypothetical protein [Opitutaceae bacterium]